MRRHVWSLAALVVLTGLFAAPPAAMADCGFQLGFADLHALIPDIVGDCVSDETHNPDNGDGLQQTENGLLVWRKADNWTAFTDGATTWINGPEGLASRPNDQRFAWEEPAPPGPRPVARRPKPGSGPQPIAPPGSGSDTPTSGPGPGSPGYVWTEGPFRFSGHGSSNTLPFSLLGGAYATAWTSRNNDGNCIMSLSSADGGLGGGGIVNDIFDGAANGANPLYNVPPGLYYVRVVGCGDWTVVVGI